ncbi:MAG: alkaline phosphatase family protein [Gemmatimonadetes bacterium]|nr:alkaline phosphatase family protein [Gemmatimonadota bacterium]
MPRLLFIFVDGVGLGSGDGAVNPLVGARLPVLQELLEGGRPLAAFALFQGGRASLAGLDAGLGVPGLPQSGTGHAALLTGENAPRLFGRHFGPWVPTALRPLVERRSFLVQALAAGRRVALANAYPEELVAAAGAAGGPARLPLPARTGPFLAARAAGLLTRHTAELARGEAVASEITNDGWIEHLVRIAVPRLSPAQAGRNLARITSRHDLTFFAHYATDHAGHRRSLAEARAALERVDAFLGGVLEELPADCLLLVASDHGNIEDIRTGHTRNPALALVVGPGHREFAVRLRDLLDVAGAVLDYLDGGMPQGARGS